jgi:uncharacterized protein (TIGR00299 family) protein
MKVAHFDCFSGISGDMTLAALFDVGVPTEPVIDGIRSFGLPISFDIQKVRKGGFAATSVRVDAPEEDEHRHLKDVEAILSRGALTNRQRELALKIFRRLAEAEAAVHGMPVSRVHFHEVGALDSIADIAGAAIGLDLLGVDEFTSGSVPTGHGTVTCAHGIMPIPTPATAELLKGVPLRASTIQAELTTPTGAAILTSVVSRWTETPAMTVERIGVGAGRKEFLEQPNVMRLFVGAANNASGLGAEVDQIWVLETNLDDVPGEIVGFAIECLFAAGALDVYTSPIAMKKNRPGTLLTVLAPENKSLALEEILFRETQTFGIRRRLTQRHKLHRAATDVETRWGRVCGKLGWLEGRPPIFTPEHEACAALARAHDVPLHEVMRGAQAAYAERQAAGTAGGVKAS